MSIALFLWFVVSSVAYGVGTEYSEEKQKT
jgi:hypothetical protein